MFIFIGRGRPFSTCPPQMMTPLFFLFRGSSTHAVHTLPLCSQYFVLWDRYQASFCFVIVNYLETRVRST